MASTKKPKTKQPKPKADVSNSNANDVAAYYAALHDPFAAQARGARFLDPVSYPTVTAVSEGVMVVTSDANGYASLAVFGDPFCTACVDVGSVSGASLYQWPVNNFLYGAANASQMRGIFSSYRVVGAGIQVRNLMQPVSTQGRVYAAKVTGTGFIPGPTFLGYSGAKDNIMNSLIRMTDIDSRILTLPESSETTMQDLIQSCLPVNTRPSSASATHFRAAAEATLWGPGLYAGEVIWSPGNPPSSAELASQHTYGRDVILLDFAGCPPNTIIAEIKYVLHYEGTPAMADAAGVVVPDSLGKTSFMPRTSAAIEMAASKQTNGSDWTKDAGRLVRDVVDGTKKAISFAKQVGEFALPLLAAL